MHFPWEGHFGKVDRGKPPFPGNIVQFHVKGRSAPQEQVPFPGKSFPNSSCSSADISCQSTSVTDPNSPSLTSLGREIPVWNRTEQQSGSFPIKWKLGWPEETITLPKDATKQGIHGSSSFPSFTGETEPKQETRSRVGLYQTGN